MTDIADFAPIRYSTNDLPQRDRFSFWRDFFAGQIVHCDVGGHVGHRAISCRGGIAGMARASRAVVQGSAYALLAFPEPGCRR